MTEEKYYKPCSTCHNADCVWMGGKDTHKKCEDYQALEQEPKTEPCEDCKSSQAVLNIIDSYSNSQSNVEDVIQDCISDVIALPSVQPKTGHWIWQTNPKCSECGGEPYFSNSIYHYKFCPYCGARMFE